MLIKRGKENGMKREMKQRFDGKQNKRFVDAYREIRFETKQILI